MNLEKLITEFLIYLEKQRGYSLNTVSSYRIDLAQFSEFCKNKSLGLELKDVIKKDSLRAYIYSLAELKRKPKTIARKRASLLSLSKYALKKEYISSNPMLLISSPKLDKPLPIHFSETQTKKLTEIVPTDEKSLRNRTIVELFYGTGIRLSELYSINEDNINHESRVIKVLGKGDKERIVPVTEYALKLLENYLTIRKLKSLPEEKALFVGNSGKRLSKRQIQRIVESELSAVSDAKKRSPHTLRHTFATQILDNGADIRLVKELLGHESLASTQIYTHITKDKLKSAFQQAHPRSGE